MTMIHTFNQSEFWLLLLLSFEPCNDYDCYFIQTVWWWWSRKTSQATGGWAAQIKGEFLSYYPITKFSSWGKTAQTSHYPPGNHHASHV